MGVRRFLSLAQGVADYEGALLGMTSDERAQPWRTEHELLAAVLEEVSVLAAERRRKEPLTAPRPRWVMAAVEAARDARRVPEPTPQGGDASYGAAIRRLRSVPAPRR